MGIAALCDIAKLAERPDCYHAGFVIGPPVNASGRLGDCSLGARLLATEDAAEARALAMRLDQYNEQRRAIEAGVLDAALADAERQVASGAEVIVCAGKGWHQGVVGIVAGRLRERFDRPALAIGIEDGIGRGSGRSVSGIALGAAVIAAAQAGILINGGGHAAAAGFTVAEDRIAEFGRFVCERVRHEQGGAPPAPVLSLDGALSPEGATRALCDELERLAPFGAGNPRPRFALASVRVAFAEAVGTDHVRCRLASAAGGMVLNAIAFRAVGSPLGRALLDAKGGTLHVAGYLRADDFQGRAGAQLVIEDAA
jgi:single-stranded-DNA-specific exonuclease